MGVVQRPMSTTSQPAPRATAPAIAGAERRTSRPTAMRRAFRNRTTAPPSRSASDSSISEGYLPRTSYALKTAIRERAYPTGGSRATFLDAVDADPGGLGALEVGVLGEVLLVDVPGVGAAPGLLERLGIAEQRVGPADVARV